MQLPLLSHLQLSSPLPHDAASSPLICSSPQFLLSPISPLPHLSSPHLSRPLLSTAWCSFLSSSALLHLTPLLLSTAWCSFLSSLICSSPLLHLSSALHCAMQLPILLICSSRLLHLTPLLLSSSDLHCVMQLPVLLPHLQLSSPPSNSSPHAISIAWCSFHSSHLQLSSPHLSAALHCVVQLPLLSHLQLSSPPSLHLTPLLLSYSDLHCVMQFPVLLPHLQLWSPPSLLSSI